MQRRNEIVDRRDEDAKAGNDAFISGRELSRLLAVEQNTLAVWRRRGIGPPWYCIHGHLIRYNRSEVLAWICSQTGANPDATSDKPGNLARGRRTGGLQ